MKAVLASVLLFVSALPMSASPRRRAVQPTDSIVKTFDFRFGTEGWEPGFADYSALSNDMQLEASIAALPREVGEGTGFRLSGHNRSDSLFMFLRKKLSRDDGIRPNRAYVVSFLLRFASNAPAMCSGIGGAPGESVTLKAGASTDEPTVSLVGNDYRLNVDKGDQSAGGAAASVVGNIANGRACEDPALYVSLGRSHRHSTIVEADAGGNLWLLVGTDSGFEGVTTLFYQTITVSLTPATP